MKVLIVFAFIGAVQSAMTPPVVIIGGKSGGKTLMKEIIDPNIVDVSCLSTQMCITVNKTWINSMWGVQDFSLMALNAPCEGPKAQDATHLTLCTRDGFLISCGTTYTVNDTHVIYSNNVTIKSQQTNDNQSVMEMEHYKQLFPWRCIFPVRLLVGVHILPQISPLTQFLGRQTGMGEFQVIMLLYRDFDYQLPYEDPPQLSDKDRILVQVKLIEGPSEAKLQVVSCWGTPTQRAINSDSEFPLIKDYCPVASDANVTVLGNGLSSNVRWESEVFRFIDFTMVYLHCNVRVCFEKDGVCEKDCSAPTFAGRKRRSVFNDAVVSLGPIEPANDVMVVRESKLIGLDVIEFPLDVTTTHSSFIRQNNSIFGLSKQAVHITVVILTLLCVVFLAAAFICVWRRKKNSKNIKHFRGYSSEQENVFVISASSQSKINDA